MFDRQRAIGIRYLERVVGKRLGNRLLTVIAVAIPVVIFLWTSFFSVYNFIVNYPARQREKYAEFVGTSLASTIEAKYQNNLGTGLDNFADWQVTQSLEKTNEPCQAQIDKTDRLKVGDFRFHDLYERYSIAYKNVTQIAVHAGGGPQYLFPFQNYKLLWISTDLQRVELTARGMDVSYEYYGMEAGKNIEKDSPHFASLSGVTLFVQGLQPANDLANQIKALAISCGAETVEIE